MIQLIKDKQLFIRRIFLILIDTILVSSAMFLALFTRFDFIFSKIDRIYLENLKSFGAIGVILTLIIFYIFKLYHSLWQFAGLKETMNILFAIIISMALQTIMMISLEIKFPQGFYPLYFIYMFVLVVFSRFSYRIARVILERYRGSSKKNIMVIGAGAAGSIIIREIINSSFIHGKVVCVVDDNEQKWGNYIQGVKIVGACNNIVEYSKEYKVDEIIIAMPSISRSRIKKIVNICKDTRCSLKTLPGIYQLVNGDVSVSRLRKVEIEDLLGRDPIEVDLDAIMGYVSNKVVMITGGGGSIGSELSRQIAAHNPKRLIIVDIYENNAYDIQQELIKKYPMLDLVVLIASVRNTNRMNYIFEKYRPEIVYHAAAHKHVPLMEVSPNEAIKNNVFGTFKMAKAADKFGVKRFVLISTDKAVNPTNIMGASKRMCEMIVQTYNNRSRTEFVAVRFGNVLGSNGSVIPLFKKQIEQGGPVTVTHPDIIRYFMTIPEAVSLVLQAGAYAKGGEIFVLDMGEPVKIADLAKNLIRLSGYEPDIDIKIEYTGLRPGEKLYEELLMDEEGLQNTNNKLIHIGKPIQLDEEKFLKDLENLYSQAISETADIRYLVQKIVPTYVIKEEDQKRHLG